MTYPLTKTLLIAARLTSPCPQSESKPNAAEPWQITRGGMPPGGPRQTCVARPLGVNEHQCDPK